MKEFSNQIIDTSQLPSIGEVSFLSLDPNYKKVVMINAAITSIVIVALSTVFYWWDFNIEKEKDFQLLPMLVLGFGILLALYICCISIIGVSMKAYAFREHDVIYKSGIILRKEIVIPYNRIQHVALHEGMISRVYRLATLEFFTAGGTNGDLKIPGIPKDQADRIKQFIVDKVQVILLDNQEDNQEERNDEPEESKDFLNVDGRL